MQSIPSQSVCIPEDDLPGILTKTERMLRTGQLTLGNFGAAFEAEFALAHGAKDAVAVSSGSAALEIILMALNGNLPSESSLDGFEVLVPTNTFFATAAAVVRAGGTPVLVDMDPLTLAPGLAHLKARHSGQTVGIIMVHIGGLISPEMPAIRQWCDAEGLFLVEDAAHAHGSTMNGKKAGSFSHAAAFSFYPTKVMTSCEGGMIVSENPDLLERARRYRDQGKQSFLTNLHTVFGSNWRLTEFNAIVGSSQLARLKEFIRLRQAIAMVYDEGLSSITHIMPIGLPEECQGNYYKYIALAPPTLDRAAAKRKLRDQYGVILSGEVYEIPLHMQPAIQNARFALWGDVKFPMADSFCKHHICLPMSNGMTLSQAAVVVEALAAVYGRQS